MKSKLLLLPLLSLAGLAAAAAPAQAWHLFGHGHGIHRHSTVIVCRPYNAFTPVCYGNMVCDGCCPFPGIGHGGHGYGGDVCADGVCGPFHGNGIHPNGFYGGEVAGPIGVPHPSQYIGAPMPLPGQQPIILPPGAQVFPPQPLPANTQTFAPRPGYQVAPTNHRAQYPLFYPIPTNVGGQQVPAQQAPAYWQGN
jgi:hypothetical protein